jgi:ATP-binding cassette subfamily F protein 3
LIFVSHDRYFIEGVAEKVLELDHGRARLFPGDYEYYLWRKDATDATHQNEGALSKAQLPAEAQADHLEKKKIKTALKKLEKGEQEIVEKLDLLEKTHNRLMREMSKPEVYSDGAKMKTLKEELGECEREQKSLTAEWNRLEGERKGLTRLSID